MSHLCTWFGAAQPHLRSFRANCRCPFIIHLRATQQNFRYDIDAINEQSDKFGDIRVRRRLHS
ncbi:predicted protein [Plenodomus lingam JN3]|uniref:Predicted protein n=1 Tax=Leptosphaeria maculans (strain JN3 / isolate v23.1.3 / race Av1-4-5-6-7-8) TaxID=985895 RepID=E4ZUM9_LEPMJ|nr:predicted protein [Plenodomus lingam JN3]CBX95108.1 predicted protein [Plenodomus lingam JN3]